MRAARQRDCRTQLLFGQGLTPILPPLAESRPPSLIGHLSDTLSDIADAGLHSLRPAKPITLGGVLLDLVDGDTWGCEYDDKLGPAEFGLSAHHAPANCPQTPSVVSASSPRSTTCHGVGHPDSNPRVDMPGNRGNTLRDDTASTYAWLFPLRAELTPC